MKKHVFLAPLFAAGLGIYCAGSERTGFDPNATPPDPNNPTNPNNPNPSCTASETYNAAQTPAAMLVALDKSESMGEGNKWNAAAQAIVQVYDQNVFDSMWLGLYAAPSGSRTGPSCVLGFPVSCIAPPFPQFDLTQAGTLKSNGASGIRRQIKDWLNTNYPDTSGVGDASPMYAAIQSTRDALLAWPEVGKRIMMIVTDGTVSCNEFSNPARPGYPDANGCSRDWENPDNIISMLRTANQDPQKPIETFIIGVPGADSYDSSATYAPPYHMRLALSAMAWAGAPKYVPANCTGKTYTQAGGDPAVSCHFDLTQGSLSASAVAAAIATARGKVAGCTYELPKPQGVEVDRTKVNVSYTIGTDKKELTRRQDMTNQCTTTGCWDYDSSGKVQLIGKACTDVQAAPSVEVRVTVGCSTIIG